MTVFFFCFFFSSFSAIFLHMRWWRPCYNIFLFTLTPIQHMESSLVSHNNATLTKAAWCRVLCHQVIFMQSIRRERALCFVCAAHPFIRFHLQRISLVWRSHSSWSREEMARVSVASNWICWKWTPPMSRRKDSKQPDPSLASCVLFNI